MHGCTGEVYAKYQCDSSMANVAQIFKKRDYDVINYRDLLTWLSGKILSNMCLMLTLFADYAKCPREINSTWQGLSCVKR